MFSWFTGNAPSEEEVAKELLRKSRLPSNPSKIVIDDVNDKEFITLMIKNEAKRKELYAQTGYIWADSEELRDTKEENMLARNNIITDYKNDSRWREAEVLAKKIQNEKFPGVTCFDFTNFMLQKIEEAEEKNKTFYSYSANESVLEEIEKKINEKCESWYNGDEFIKSKRSELEEEKISKDVIETLISEYKVSFLEKARTGNPPFKDICGKFEDGVKDARKIMLEKQEKLEKEQREEKTRLEKIEQERVQKEQKEKEKLEMEQKAKQKEEKKLELIEARNLLLGSRLPSTPPRIEIKGKDEEALVVRMAENIRTGKELYGKTSWGAYLGFWSDPNELANAKRKNESERKVIIDSYKHDSRWREAEEFAKTQMSAIPGVIRLSVNDQGIYVQKLRDNIYQKIKDTENANQTKSNYISDNVSTINEIQQKIQVACELLYNQDEYIKAKKSELEKTELSEDVVTSLISRYKESFLEKAKTEDPPFKDLHIEFEDSVKDAKRVMLEKKEKLEREKREEQVRVEKERQAKEYKRKQEEEIAKELLRKSRLPSNPSKIVIDDVNDSAFVTKMVENEEERKRLHAQTNYLFPNPEGLDEKIEENVRARNNIINEYKTASRWREAEVLAKKIQNEKFPGVIRFNFTEFVYQKIEKAEEVNKTEHSYSASDPSIIKEIQEGIERACILLYDKEDFIEHKKSELKQAGIPEDDVKRFIDEYKTSFLERAKTTEPPFDDLRRKFEESENQARKIALEKKELEQEKPVIEDKTIVPSAVDALKRLSKEGIEDEPWAKQYLEQMVPVIKAKKKLQADFDRDSEPLMGYIIGVWVDSPELRIMRQKLTSDLAAPNEEAKKIRENYQQESREKEADKLAQARLLIIPGHSVLSKEDKEAFIQKLSRQVEVKRLSEKDGNPKTLDLEKLEKNFFDELDGKIFSIFEETHKEDFQAKEKQLEGKVPMTTIKNLMKDYKKAVIEAEKIKVQLPLSTKEDEKLLQGNLQKAQRDVESCEKKMTFTIEYSGRLGYPGAFKGKLVELKKDLDELVSFAMENQEKWLKSANKVIDEIPNCDKLSSAERKNYLSALVLIAEKEDRAAKQMQENTYLYQAFNYFVIQNLPTFVVGENESVVETRGIVESIEKLIKSRMPDTTPKVVVEQKLSEPSQLKVDKIKASKPNVRKSNVPAMSKVQPTSTAQVAKPDDKVLQEDLLKEILDSNPAIQFAYDSKRKNFAQKYGAYTKTRTSQIQFIQELKEALKADKEIKPVEKAEILHSALVLLEQDLKKEFRFTKTNSRLEAVIKDERGKLDDQFKKHPTMHKNIVRDDQSHKKLTDYVSKYQSKNKSSKIQENLQRFHKSPKKPKNKK